MDCYILRSHLLGDGRIALERVEAVVAPRSGCVEDGCLPLYEVMHMSGHKSLVMVQRYWRWSQKIGQLFKVYSTI